MQVLGSANCGERDNEGAFLMRQRNELIHDRSPKSVEPSRLRVAVIRHTLYKMSEQFIPMQALALPRADVLMVARDRIVNRVDGLRTSTIADAGRLAVLRHTLLRHPGPLKDILAANNIEVVHAHFGVEGLYSQQAAKQLQIPHVTTLHGFDVSMTKRALVDSRRPAWLHYAKQRRDFLASADALVCVSNHIRNLAVDLGADENKISVIGTGVHVDKIQPTDLPDNAVVLHVARLVEKKGTSYLIDAFARVVKKVPGAQLRIIGEGPLDSQLKAQVERLNLGSSISFLGVQPHDVVLSEISKARIFCMPSVTAESGDQEGLGQVLLEAGASARPVVATKHGGIVDAVVDGESGLLVPERDVPRLAEAISSLLDDEPTARRFGLGARRRVEAEFDVRIQATKLEQVYRGR